MNKKLKLTIQEIVKFGMLGAVVYALKVIMAPLPNIEPVTMLVVVYTVVYRSKALYPIAVYILLEGLFGGFTVYWLPYLYVWPLLWGVVMLLPKDMPDRKYGRLVYMGICTLFGLLFGTLFTPAYAVIMGLNFQGMVDWIIAGLPYDLLHGAGNLALSILIPHVIKILRKLDNLLKK